MQNFTIVWNNNVEVGGEIYNEALETLETTIEHLDYFSKYNQCNYREFKEQVRSNLECFDSFGEIRDELKRFTHEDFENYALDFEFVEADETHDGYYRYLITTGGPHYELRFFEYGEIQFVYLDYRSGIGFECSKVEPFKWTYYQFTYEMNWHALKPHQKYSEDFKDYKGEYENL